MRTAFFVIATTIAASAGLAPRIQAQQARAATDRSYVPYAEARPILETLRQDLLPPELQGKTPRELEEMWPDWVAGRDAAIRARVEQGEEETVVHVLLFGTSFTKLPVVTQPDPAAARDQLRARIEDFVAAVASPGVDQRLQFARQVLVRQGIDPATAEGRNLARRYLEDRAEAMGAAASESRRAMLGDPTAESVDRRTLFRDRGLTFNTSLLVNLAIEEAVKDMQGQGLIRPAVRRVAIVGPGLEFTEKQDGYDFYPPQTIQPFAIVDSLVRLGLATADALEITVFDLSPRIIDHLESARNRARAGEPYAIVLPRNLDRPWLPALVRSWERFGERIGTETAAVAPPTDAGRVAVRSILVRPSAVLLATPSDLNIVLQRPAPMPPNEQFDLILATNILIYYGVFEQSLAVANIARMLRTGGFFLSNDPVFELPATPIDAVGSTNVNYMELPGIGEVGDRITWYQRQ
jgi:hypothetical protein